MNGPSVRDSKLGVVHAAPAAIGVLPELIHEAGQGRAFVLVASGGVSPGRALVESTLAHAQIPAHVVEFSARSDQWTQVEQIASSLAAYAGGVLVTVGDSGLIAMGKAIATVATNSNVQSTRSIVAAPRVHIVVPTTLGPAVESTHLLTLEGDDQPIEDIRLAALSVIDDRVFAENDGDTDSLKLHTVALAACVIATDTSTLRDSTLALMAVHRLVDPDVGPAVIREAQTLASAGHPMWPKCPHCHAGTSIRTSVLSGDSAHSPARACLREAVARGLTIAG